MSEIIIHQMIGESFSKIIIIFMWNNKKGHWGSKKDVDVCVNKTSVEARRE